MIKTERYGVIRKSDDSDHEWLDFMEFSAGACEKHVERVKAHIPEWHAHNPVQRIVKVVIAEVE